jgi:hypothetical protein
MTDFDWRLLGQERYMTGLTLFRRTWRQTRADLDHDHCEFCGAKFSASEDIDVLHEGWTTHDEYRWVCDPCFRDFRDRFQWRVG